LLSLPAALPIWQEAARVFEACVGDAGTDAPRGASVVELLQRVEPRNVDQQARPREPQVQHRSERLPAGQELGPGGPQRRQSLRNVAWPDIVEACRLHAMSVRAGAPARSIAASRRRGVSGVSVSSTPSGRNASLTALKTTAGGAMAPPSPMPLMPNSV